MVDVLLDTLIDALKMLPFLILVYLIIELLEHKAMDKIRKAFSSERLGIISAALLGIFPECGFSVAAANLYAERLISAGTLVAVYVSTSDEAIPIIASNPGQIKWLLPLIAIKFVYAILAGFIVNLLFRVTRLDRAEQHIGHHSEHIHESGEHHHCAHCDSGKGIIESVLKRSLSIFLYILAIGFVLNTAIWLIGEDRLGALLMTNSIAQPFIAALIGMIPNCAASVVLSELFVSGALSFGSLAAGLSAGAGVGMIVLLRVNHSTKQNAAIIGSLYLLSALLGVLLQILI